MLALSSVRSSTSGRSRSSKRLPGRRRGTQQRQQRIRVGPADTPVSRDQEQALAHRAQNILDLPLGLDGGVCRPAGAPGEIQHGGQQQRRQTGAAEQQAAQRLPVVHDRLAQVRGKIAKVGGQGRGVLRLRDQQFIDGAFELCARSSVKVEPLAESA